MDQIRSGFIEAGIGEFPPAAYERFQAYLDLLLRWNQRLNLTAIRDPRQIVRRHFVECSFAARHLPAIGTLLDYGAGAGFPGIPIAICRPEIQVTLAEAQGKKAAFLHEVLRVLDLRAQVYDGRVEDMPEGDRYDAVALRAVEKMESAVPFAVQRAKAYLVLLTTIQSAALAREITAGLEWLDPLPLPNSEQMILAIGKRF